jgi:hypothetical protein
VQRNTLRSDTHHIVPHLRGEVDAACLRQHAGVVDQHVDTAIHIDAAIDDRIGRRFLADVRRDRLDLRAEFAAEFGLRIEPRRVEIGEHEARARFGIRARDRRADAACRTGDDRAAALE